MLNLANLGAALLTQNAFVTFVNLVSIYSDMYSGKKELNCTSKVFPDGTALCLLLFAA